MNEGGRWRNEQPYGYQDFDPGFPRPRGGRGRRGRGMNGRGFGRGMRGMDRSREFNRDFQSYRQDGPRSASYRSPERMVLPPQPMPPVPPEQPYTENYGYYGYPPFSPQSYPSPTYNNQEQPIPLPVTNTGYPLDPTRMYLLGQVEYYFSIQNLARDTHLRRQVSKTSFS